MLECKNNSREAAVVYKNGYPFISFNNELIEPIMFRSFRPMPSNISLFSRVGVRINQILVSGQMNGMDIPYSLYGPVWIDDDCYDFEAFERQLNVFEKFSPNSYFIVFIQLDTPEEWLKNHKESESSFYNLQAGSQNTCWKLSASKYLRTFIEYCEKNHNSKICGYMISAGRSCEWFSGNNLNIKSIQNAFQKSVDGTGARSVKRTYYKSNQSILRKDNSYEMRFLRFCEKNTVNLALFFANEAQKVLNHRKLLGLFGGYFALKSNELLTNLFEQVWESSDIDMICAPALYDDFRKIENASGITIPLDSLKLKNKLHINELDHRTELAYYPCEYPVLQKNKQMKYRLLDGNFMDDCYSSHFESEMILRRELASTLQKGSAFWWFDFYGGYYGNNEYEKMLAQHTSIYKRVNSSNSERKNLSDVAIIVDTPAMTFIKDGGCLQEALVYCNLREIAKSGILYDVYNISDIRSIKFDKYKCAIFLNALCIDEDNCRYILDSMKNIYKVWIYAARIVDSNLTKMSKLIGLNIRRMKSDKQLLSEYNNITFGFKKVISPMFYIDDNKANVITKYKNSECISGAQKGSNIYFSCGNIPSEVWRHIFSICGAHIYTNIDGALYANSNFICYQTVNTENVVLDVSKNGRLEELFDGGIYTAIDGQLRYTAKKGTTKLFIWID